VKTMENLRNVTLEVSLKPFGDASPAAMESAARRMFTQWGAMLRHADAVSVLLWAADGSEILDYGGDLDETFDWARYLGCCNGYGGPFVPRTPDGPSGLNFGYYLYAEDTPVYIYRMLKDLAAILRRVGAETTGKPVRVGATFDPGPEFARSPFKYERHPEINISYCEPDGKCWFLCCYSRLHADTRKYAGYPGGIPEDTPIGEFLGRQSRHFLKDLGFDYLWLSNGLGFGLEPWKCTGRLFDGKAFHPEYAEAARRGITDFWTQFRRECPGIRVEVRGTNMGAGIDIATDGISFRDLYDGGFDFLPPPNSPWAALDGDFGLELTGYMSRIAELPPGEEFPFRFYTHDPWWMNSPWIDRYQGYPHDIYMPLALSRIDGSGRILHSASLSLLSVDNALGGMPDCVPDEVTPYIIRAYADSPDAPPPLVWVYPFGEYDDLGKRGECLDKMYFEDWYVRGAVNRGLPLSGVVSTDNFISSSRKNPGLYAGSILMAPIPAAGSRHEEALCSHVEKGGQVMFYGALAYAGERLRTLLGLSCGEPVSGECALAPGGLWSDRAAFLYPGAFLHDALLCGGGLCECADPAEKDVRILARAEKNGESRAICASRQQPSWSGGQAVWLRGTCSCTVDAKQFLPEPHDPERYYPMESLARSALSEFGYRIGFGKALAGQRDPVVMIHRCENGFFFSGYCPDTTVEIELRFPLGAPLLLGYETVLRDGCSTYRMPRAWHYECRAFVSQEDGPAPVSCFEDTPRDARYRRHVRLRGLRNATVYVFPYPGYERKLRLICGVERYGDDPDGIPFDKELVGTPYGPAWKCGGVTGTLSWLTELDEGVLW
jgi:hypothetical protein